jgi:hypothetical protein
VWTHDYVGEKLRELDAELARRAPFRPPLDARYARRTPVRPRLSPGPVVGGPVRMTGGVLHWIGGALHRTGHRWRSWATPAASVVAAPDALARMTGRALPRIGHRLQSWGTPATVEGNAALVAATPGTPWWKVGC